MTEKEIPKLLEESKEATVTQVLTGDYNLKIARQDYFTSNQDKVRTDYFMHTMLTHYIEKEVVVVLLFYVHGKHLRSCQDCQLT